MAQVWACSADDVFNAYVKKNEVISSGRLGLRREGMKPIPNI